MRWTSQHSQQAMIALGGTVGLAAAFAPETLQRAFGITADDVTGSNKFGWRLFATRNIYLAARALSGDPAAVIAFGHLQALDQVVFWHAFANGSVPRSTALLATTTSAAIVAFDVHRRAGV